jgi:hypothetical protein
MKQEQALSDAELDVLLAAVSRDYLIDIGWQVYRDDLGSAPMSTDQLLLAGKTWVKSRYQDMQKCICPNSEYIESLLRTDAAEAVVIVGDLLSGLAIGVSPFTLGRFCLQFGVKKLCRGYRQP